MEILSLKNVKSYSPYVSTIIDLSKKINIFWGQNGSGKSTISGYFYSPTNPKYSQCSFTTDNPYHYIVYNSQFVEDSFYNKIEQPGIFTLSKKNKEIIELIENKKRDNEKLKQDLERIRRAIEDKQNKIESILTEFRDNVWNKTHDIRVSDLKDLLSGCLKKMTFSSKLETINEDEDIDLIELKTEYNKLLLYKDTSIKKITIPKTYQVPPTVSELLKTSMISSGDSYLSRLINELCNSDWVQEGINYIKDEKCPFCQKNTIDKDFKNEIKQLFDNTYNENLKKLSAFLDEYEKENKNYISLLKDNLNASEYIKNDHEIRNKVQDYENQLTNNIKEIIYKQQKPSSVIELTDLSELSIEIEEIINGINAEIESINQRVINYKKSIEALKLKLWKMIKFKCNDLIQNKNAQLSKIELEKDKLEEQKKKIIELQKKLSAEIVDKEKEVSNIDETIDSINQTLISLGINQFKIAKHKENKNFFQLVRENNSSECVYQSLSEGEKTIITFLYFVELCLGSTVKESEQHQDKLIVIDDPISSLSLHYIYEIASLINHRLFDGSGIKKIIILTHNLFFYKELVPSNKSMRLKVFKKNVMLYKVIKNEFSTVEKLDRNEIKNDYQTLWMILKDAKNKKVNSVIVPNIMRNILEYYFSFQCANEKLNDVLNNLTNEESLIENKAFYRYINNGSHSNSINSSGIISLPIDRYFSMFENIFRKTDNFQHYQYMIEDNFEIDDV